MELFSSKLRATYGVYWQNINVKFKFKCCLRKESLFVPIRCLDGYTLKITQLQLATREQIHTGVLLWRGHCYTLNLS